MKFFIKNSILFVFRCYNFGVKMDFFKLYFVVDFFVFRGIFMIFFMIQFQWDYLVDWDVLLVEDMMVGVGGDFGFVIEFVIGLDFFDNYLIGYCIDGRVLFLVIGYLVFVW